MEGANHPSEESGLCSMGGGAATTISEESGWTSYIEYFMASNKGGAAATSISPSSFVGCSSSVVSDAASGVSDAASCVSARKEEVWAYFPETGVSVSLAKLKKKKKIGGYDESLEDTASSPISSPKVQQLLNSYTLDSNASNKYGITEMSIFQEREFASPNHLDMTGEINGMSFAEKANANTELKEKGLCLVPFSMLVDYFG